MKKHGKKSYTKPSINKVNTEISMVMMSPFGHRGDTGVSIVKMLNPVRWWK